MSISIVSCPKCGTFLLSETAQCHRCRHVLNPERAQQFRDSALPTDAAIQQDSERCRQCGETCRKGLVRCWSCGAFTRPEIEEAYYRLLQGHSRALATSRQKYELPEITEAEARQRFLAEDDETIRPATPSRTAEFTAMDEDFELDGTYHLMEESHVDDAADVANGIPPLAEIPPLATAAIPLAEQAISITPAGDVPPPAPAVESAPVVDEAERLLDAAKQEETDSRKARKARLGEGFVIYCPMGCKIRVQERHRGKIGRCPKCQSTFMVPMAAQTSVSGAVPPSAGEAAAAPIAAATESQRYPDWMQDIHLHRVIPQKLRIKADSLLKDFTEVDVGFDPEGVLLVGLPAAGGGGLFAKKGVNKKDEARAAVLQHLRTKPTAEGLPAPFQQPFAPEGVQQFALSQPAPPGAESLFGDILVFGEGRIAVRLPKFDEKTTAYLSFSLSEFREFSRLLAMHFGIPSFGSGCGIPLVDEYKTDSCHVIKKPVKELQHLVYYQKDPSIQLEISGYRCKVCSAVISEAARAAQKLGGANGKGIAKAKCPKCTKPLGYQPLYVMPVPTAADTAVENTAAGEPAAAETPQVPAESVAV